jgi:hypothetical protein
LGIGRQGYRRKRLSPWNDDAAGRLLYGLYLGHNVASNVWQMISNAVFSLSYGFEGFSETLNLFD